MERELEVGCLALVDPAGEGESSEGLELRSKKCAQTHRVGFVFVFSLMRRMLLQLCMTVISLNFYQKNAAANA